MSTENKPKNTGTKTLSNNVFIERITRTHISLPLIIFSCISIYLLYRGVFDIGLQPVTMLLMFVSGALFFTLVEYIMHRYLFHMTPNTPTKEKIAYAAHGVHHDYPKDKDRLAMPIPASLLLSYLFYLLYQYLMGDMVYAFLPGFLIGYASYLGVHYMVHAYQPPKNVFKVLWVHHGIHHYKQQTRAFGVSSPLWDHIFRSMPK